MRLLSCQQWAGAVEIAHPTSTPRGAQARAICREHGFLPPV
jgi:hypothetical protein